MEWTITETNAPALFTMRVVGRFTLEECRRAVAELAAVKHFLTAVLFDDREVDFGGVTDADLLAMAAMLGEYVAPSAFAGLRCWSPPTPIGKWRTGGAGSRTSAAKK